MRIYVAAALAALSLAAAPAVARPLDVQPGLSSSNVEWIKNIPIAIDSAGAEVIGKYLYVTTSRDLTIYDISDPENPARLGFLVLPQQPYFAEEDVDTNGKILLIGTLGNLYVIDVEDKSNPAIIGQVAGGDNHTVTCVLDCKWAYGSGGYIADLRDPSNPEIVGDWGEGLPASGSHDVTEVSPGLVVTSSNPIQLLDARKNPAKPKLLATGTPPDDRYNHGSLWPRGGKDRFLLVGSESSGPTCDENDASFQVWDTAGWKKTKSFRLLEDFRVANGLPTNGDALANLFCGHWFDVHPGYRNGGVVAMAWYEHGTRFLQVSKKGAISEIGWFLPAGGSTSAAYWITDEIVYAVDYNRGIDILRFTG